VTTMAAEALQRACEQAGEGRLRLERRILRLDGEVRWIVVRGQGAKQAEEQLRKILGLLVLTGT
jgi:hypothetical protein